MTGFTKVKPPQEWPAMLEQLCIFQRAQSPKATTVPSNVRMDDDTSGDPTSVACMLPTQDIWNTPSSNDSADAAALPMSGMSRFRSPSLMAVRFGSRTLSDVANAHRIIATFKLPARFNEARKCCAAPRTWSGPQHSRGTIIAYSANSLRVHAS